MISLGEVNLLLPDLDGELQSWIDRWLPTEAMRDQTHPVSLMNSRPQSTSGFRPGVGLAIPNYPEPPAPKINSLYWPTGASRWARGYFLAHQNQMYEILEQIGDENTDLQLVLQDDTTGVRISPRMYLLQPRPLSAVWPGQEPYQVDGLYLLPLVDERYYWQYKSTGELSGESVASWSNMYLELATALGIAGGISVDSIASTFYIPDKEELSREYENAAIMLDAVAHSVGQRIVRQLDGTVYSVNSTTSGNTYNQNIEVGNMLMGGSLDGKNKPSVRPATVTVTFQRWRECQVDPNGIPHVEVINAVGGATEETTKIIHSSAFADYSLKEGTPSNSSQVSALANEIASAFYHWLDHNYDLSFSSLFNWRLNGFDDHVEWCFGYVSHEQYQAYTRVHGRPYNFGDEEQLQQFPNMPVYPRLARFKLTTLLLPGWENVDAVFMDSADGKTEKTDVLHIFDTTGHGFGQIGEIGWAEYKSDSLQWEFVCMEGCLTRHGKAVARILNGNTGTVMMHYALSGVETPAAIGLSCRNVGATIEAGTGAIVWYEAKSQQWYAIGSGGGDTTSVVVKVAGYSSGETTCMYDGTLQTIDGDTPASVCSNPFTTGDACYLMPLNYEGGSFSPAHLKLVVGEFYLGKVVGSIGGVPLVAIRIASQVFHTTCPTPGVNAMAYINVPLGFATPSCRNWTNSRINYNDPVTVYWDRFDANWYMIASGGTNATRIWHSTSAAVIHPGEFGNVILSTGETKLAFNWSATVEIAPFDLLHVYQDPFDDVYYIIKAESANPGIDPSAGNETIRPGNVGDITLSTTDVVAARDLNQLSVYAGNSVLSFMLGGQRIVVPLGTHVHHLICPAPGVNAGASINVMFPDGVSRAVTNWSSYRITAEANIFVVMDKADNLWYMWPTNFPLGWNLFVTELYAGVTTTSGSASVKPSTPSWKFVNAADIPVAPYDVANPLGLYGETDDKCIVAEKPGIADGALSTDRCLLVAVFNQHRIYHGTALYNIAASGHNQVSRNSVGGSVDAYNWSDTAITAGDKVHVYQDPGDLRYYAIKSGGQTVQVVRFQLNSSLPATVAGTAPADVLDWTNFDWQPTGEVINVTDFTERFWSGDTQDLKGWATAMPGHPGVYEIIWMESFQPHIYAKRSSATVVTDHVMTTGDDMGGLIKINNPVEIRDPYLLLPASAKNDRCAAVLDSDTGYYNKVYGQSTAGFTTFTSNTKVPENNESPYAFATMFNYWGTQADYLNPMRCGDYLVVDAGYYEHVVGAARGIGTHDAALNNSVDPLGESDQIYHPIVLDQRSFLVRAVLDDDVASTDATARVVVLGPMLYFPFSLDVPSNEFGGDGSLTVDNPLRLSGSVASQCVICWDENVARYILFQVKPKRGVGTTWFRGTIRYDFTQTDPFVAVENLVQTSEDSLPPAGVVSAANNLRWRGNAGDPCYVIENDAGSITIYELMSVAWDVVTRVADVTYTPGENNGLYRRYGGFLSKEVTPLGASLQIVRNRKAQVVDIVKYNAPDLTAEHRSFVYLGDVEGSVDQIDLIHHMVDQIVVDSVVVSGNTLTDTRKTVTVWDTAEAAGQSYIMYTVATVGVVSDVYMSGLDLYKKFQAMTVLVDGGIGAPVIIVSGTDCPPP